MNIKRFFSVVCLVLMSVIAMAQGYEIKVSLTNVPGDSIHLQTFMTKEYKNTQSFPNAKEIVFKGKTSLEPGIYQINADTVTIGTFFISDKKNQKFAMNIVADDQLLTTTTFSGSAENMAFVQYLDDLGKINKKMDLLNQEFNEMQQGGMPQYMMQIFVDSLMARAAKIDQESETFQRKIIAEHPTWISSSVIKASIAMPQPPQEALQNKQAYYLYRAQHMLDNFPYDDERFYGTSFAFDLTNQFTRLVWETGDFAFDETEKIVNKVLDNCKVSQ